MLWRGAALATGALWLGPRVGRSSTASVTPCQSVTSEPLRRFPGMVGVPPCRAGAPVRAARARSDRIARQRLLDNLHPTSPPLSKARTQSAYSWS